MHLIAARDGLREIPRMLLPLVGVAVGGVGLGHAFDPRTFVDAPTWVMIAAMVLGLGLVAWRGDWKARRTMFAMTALAVGV